MTSRRLALVPSPSMLKAIVATDGFDNLSKCCGALKQLMCKLAAR